MQGEALNCIDRSDLEKVGETERFLFWEIWETHLYLVARTSRVSPGFTVLLDSSCIKQILAKVGSAGDYVPPVPGFSLS